MQQDLKQYLTLRYAIALSVVFLVLLVTLVTFLMQINSAKNDAYLLNISGMQRMLSQRIGLMTREVGLSDTRDDASPYLAKLSDAIAKMQSNHLQLVNGEFDNGYSLKMSSLSQEMYFGSKDIDKRVSEFLENARKLIVVVEDEGTQTASAQLLSSQIVAIARNGLLADLDDIVKLYEREASQRITKFEYLKILTFVIGTLVLIMEAIFIFRPMTNTIVSSAKDLAARNNELLEFSYRVSHDVRAPIKSISGLVEVVDSCMQTNKIEQASLAVGHMRTNVNQLERLTDDIIGLTKSKMSSAATENVNVHDLLKNCVKSLRFVEGYENIQITTSCDIKGLILCKRLYLQQIVENLVSNAIKYSDPQKDTQIVNITSWLSGNRLTVSVEDNGLGIDEKHRSRLFQMFQRFHPKASFGTGLGLYLVAQHANALEGEITYEATSDGSKFVLNIPIARSAQ